MVDDQRHCWVPLQGTNFHFIFSSTFRNNNEFCLELLGDVTAFSTLLAHKNWVLLSGVYAGIVFFVCLCFVFA